MRTTAPPDLDTVPFDALDGSRLLGLDGVDGPVRLARAVRAGLPARAFDALREALALPAPALAEALGIAPRTLARRRAAGRLATDESDRLLRAARLAEMAAVALGDDRAGAEWMTEPHALFGGEPPLRHADTAPGARAVEDALYAVEFTAAA
ncbi:antitoxin Xre-like helix-turn-helix domain-containing protein [Rubrivirga sp. S365]|uniref:Antitoxin Xre-like helix-turn-helix domain-containing protein n=1 Tax=Rubrivirga litoralis TaxID=3075598 RepID=A0ABU3BTQ9_9BACT|nr:MULTISPECIES: antitoxin Xre-like helix-turn-helix domain-containing protein [unclassified Rubrivirga]MDT0632663.1 antitoxin Xre-like helix-turn-helix domain-containing protein [Rubrivirga sp. F394]MDT7857160.1 antitoxin Xre-like helix-turn-helix domain-containing protein [Rubrivirga sp. S365]